MKPALITRAARINFLAASLIPFFTGWALALSAGFNINPMMVFLGAMGIASAHIAGNVLNDLADHQSGNDLIDDRRSPFFGGSKVIKDGLVTFREMIFLAAVFFAVALACALVIFLAAKDPVIILMLIGAGVLTAGYSLPPLKFSYRRLGELDIFLLFGVLPVAGSFYIFAGKFPGASVVVSLPVAFLITAVILCNEVPDATADRAAGKLNLISSSRKANAYKLYAGALILSYISIVANVVMGLASPFILLAAIFYVPGIKAALIIRNSHNDFEKLIKASAMTIALHFFAGIGIIIAVMYK